MVATTPAAIPSIVISGSFTHAEGEGKEDASSPSYERSKRADVVLLYYLYIDIPDPEAVCEQQKQLCADFSLYGRIRVTPEGLNGTLDGTHRHIDQYMREMDSIYGEKTIDWKLATYPDMCDKRFNSVRISVKEEVVALHLDSEARRRMLEVGPGRHLTPEQFHAQLEQPTDNLVLLDVRNFYETRIGRFEFTPAAASAAASAIAAIDPKTRSFSDFRHYVDAHAAEYVGKKVLMYCTGGVRCERASAYLKSKAEEHGQTDVYQLFGGIHGYQEKYPQGFFKGKNFVYDPRVAVSAADAAPVAALGASSAGASASASASARADAPSTTLLNPGLLLHAGDQSGSRSATAASVPVAHQACGLESLSCIFDWLSPSPSPSPSASLSPASARQRPVTSPAAAAAEGTRTGGDGDIVGSCMVCFQPWDNYCSPYSRASSSQTRCCYCRVLLLVCESCKSKHAADDEVMVLPLPGAGTGTGTGTSARKVAFLKSLQCEMCSEGWDGNLYSAEEKRKKKSQSKPSAHADKKAEKRLRAQQHKEAAVEQETGVSVQRQRE